MIILKAALFKQDYLGQDYIHKLLYLLKAKLFLCEILDYLQIQNINSLTVIKNFDF